MTITGAMDASTPLVAQASAYDAILLVSYGGPEGPDDVLPFLENATRGRNVPRDRLLSVAEHYHHFGGVSPINAQNRALGTSLESALAQRGHPMRVYLGNRNWHPFLRDTIAAMRDDGVRRVLAVVTSAFSSYSGCRQYREDVIGALQAVGATAPSIDKVRVYFNHPLFVDANAANLRTALDRIASDARERTRVVFTAHSIPQTMASHCNYELQLREAARLVATAAGVSHWDLAFQSRSGPPHVPWLEPDIIAYLEQCAADGASDVVVLPLGFISDHMEVMYDIDIEALDAAQRLGLHLVRANTVGVSPVFVEMLCELIAERQETSAERRAIGNLPAWHDVCPVNCCLDGRSGSGSVPLARAASRTP